MGSEWRSQTLGDFVTLQRGHDLPEEYRRHGSIPVLGSFGVTGWHDEARAPGPGVTVGRSGASFGIVSYTAGEYWPLNTALYVTDFHGNDPRFAYYFLKTFNFTRFNSGSAQPSLNRNFIHPVEVRIPPLDEQVEIANLLGALDDKIELNRRMVETLDEIGRALFKSWFVNFDPVHAKAQSRQTGLADDLTSLFPDSFGEDGLPTGWRSKPLSAVTTITKGRSYTSDELRPSGVALVTLKSFNRGGGYKTDGLKAFSGSYKPTQVVAPGELLIAATDVTQAAEVIGQPAIVEKTSAFETLVASLDTFIIRPSDQYLTPWILDMLLREQGFPRAAQQYTTGTTVLHLNARVFDHFEVILPPPMLLQKTVEKLGSALARKRAAREESQTLAELREALLPKLISGELRITDAEKRIVAA